MDPRLTRLYEEELAHLRDLGREFAREHPKARHLELENMEVADPYVERLLEGFAFLTARVRLKMDAEQPRLIEQLLQSLYPNFLAPMPSQMVVQLTVDPSDPNLARGYAVARGAPVRSLLKRGQETQCEYRTAMALTLWPLELAECRYFNHAPELGLTRLPAARGVRGGLRVRLRLGGGLQLGGISLDRLVFYIAAEDNVAFRLHELLMGSTVGTALTVPGQPVAESRWHDAATLRAVGYEPDQALLPETDRHFSGHRLLQEFAALPQRLLFFEITDLASRLAGLPGNELDLVIGFSRADAGLETLVDVQSLALHCTPAINLFPKRLDRVTLDPGNAEFHVVPDRTRPMDYEVHSVDRVVGHGSSGSDGARDFAPLYASTHQSLPDGNGYFALRRAPRRPSDRQRQNGARVASYLGEEVYLSLVDAHHGAYRDDLRQLSVIAHVTNRDLPALLPREGSEGESSWVLEAAAPVTAVRSLRGPTRPTSRRPEGDVGWQLVSQLTQNHLAPGNDPERAAAALRTALRLYGTGDAAWIAQVDGLRALIVTTVTRRLPMPGPLCFGCGIALDLEVDDAAFHGASAFLLGCVLDHFFARHAAINSFTQLSLRSAQRGLIKAWPPRLGERAVA